MFKTKFPILKSLHGGQKGFTLIELLIVVAILGVIAAVVVLNVGGFLGSGTEEAANTEAHQVQTAIIGYMVDGSHMTLDGGTVDAADTCTTNGTEEQGIACFLLNPALLQAGYVYGTDGAITDADAALDGKWSDCTFASGTWTC